MIHNSKFNAQIGKMLIVAAQHWLCVLTHLKARWWQLSFSSALVLVALALYPEIKSWFNNIAQDQPETSHISQGEFKPAPLAQYDIIEALSPPGGALTQRQLTIKSGATLDQALNGAGLNAADRYKIIQAMRDHLNPRNIRAGDQFTLRLNKDNGLVDLRHEIDNQSILWVRQAANETETQYQSELIPIPVQKFQAYRKGIIKQSLYVDAVAKDVPEDALISMIKLFSFDVDFQREIRKDDAFEIFYEGKTNMRGEAIGNHPILMASLTLSGKTYRYYRYDPSDLGDPDLAGFYDETGKTAVKGLLRTPIDGARLSSSFGYRKHPILGYNKLHKGTDFAAPRGTPIYAAGDGVVEYSGRNGSYGNFIRIRHSNGYKTAYAHLHRIHKKATKGARVSQYQVIGYVGTTGRSTGPHLHYEVLYNGKHVNPMKVKMPTNRQLKDSDLADFEKGLNMLKAQIDESKQK
ncbi:MAG: peptidoglycan DD-metalloendopeptidase family protein [Alphaproteobacteria bacterium]